MVCDAVYQSMLMLTMLMMQYGTFFKLKCVKTTMFKFREISNYTQGNGALGLKLLPPETHDDMSEKVTVK